eukprot:175525-Chlamydomonas_euryale.AAC.1
MSAEGRVHTVASMSAEGRVHTVASIACAPHPQRAPLEGPGTGGHGLRLTVVRVISSGVQPQHLVGLGASGGVEAKQVPAVRDLVVGAAGLVEVDDCVDGGRGWRERR